MDARPFEAGNGQRRSLSVLLWTLVRNQETEENRNNEEKLHGPAPLTKFWAVCASSSHHSTMSISTGRPRGRRSRRSVGLRLSLLQRELEIRDVLAGLQFDLILCCFRIAPHTRSRCSLVRQAQFRERRETRACRSTIVAHDLRQNPVTPRRNIA